MLVEVLMVWLMDPMLIHPQIYYMLLEALILRVGLSWNKVTVWDSINWMPFGDNSEFKNPGTLTSVIKYNGDIIVAGLFDSIGNNAIQNIARWDGNAWQPLGDKFDNTIYELEIYNGSLYAGGAFFHCGSDFCRHIAKWNGQIWTEVGSGFEQLRH